MIIRTIKIIFVIFSFLFSSIPLLYADDPSKDFFYSQMQESLSAPQTHSVQENVDPFSGNLKLVHTDFQLPQNGGLSLKIMRSYNSAIWGRRDISFPGFIAHNERSPIGIGWSMHMGIVKNPFGGDSSNQYLTNNPIVEMPDGSQHPLFKVPGQQNTFISKERWIYKYINTNGTWELTLTDGTVYTFRYNPAGPGYTTYDNVQVAQVTNIRNAANTASISINYTRYQNDTYSYLTSITDSTGRTITYTYEIRNNLRMLAHIDLSYQRLMTYSHQYVNPENYLSTAQPPVGNSWQYSYNSTNHELQTLTYPSGGTITYTFSDIPFDTGKVTNVKFSVVTQRTTGGRGIPSGTWSYSYNSNASPATTTITAPNGVTETHKFHSWASSCPSRQGSCGNVWKIGLPISKQISGSASLSESYAWVASGSISNDRISNSGWNGTGGFIYDAAIYVPRQSSKSITRDGKTYTTTYSNYDSYDNPTSIAETGDVNRNTSLSYWYNTSKNIIANTPDVVTISGSFSESFSTDYAYDTNGNVTQITKNGVPTYFTYDGSGNLDTVRDANNHTTSFDWSYGRISKKQNPIYAITRIINSDGTIASETNGKGFQTSYTYDGNLRLTRISPPIGNYTAISYPSNHSSKTQTRGGYSITTSYDGFGRQTGTSDSKGISTSIGYRAYGPKLSSGSNVGDTVNYDFFERIDNVVHKDNQTIDYAYSNSNVAITDEIGKQTTLTYNAFGNPDEKFLMSVKDAINNTTSYTYNMLGSLLTINQPGVTQRTFTYNLKNFLVGETHPDRGHIGYTRDGVGNMTTKSDSLDTTDYTYDAINRLIRASNDSGTIDYGYDNADNRTSMTNGGASISYQYDAVNKMTVKNETIKGQAYNSQYSYDENDNMTDIYYPGGRHLQYTYNSNNQVTSLPGFVTAISYYTSGIPIGLPYKYTNANGHTTTFTYNNRNLTTGMTAGPSSSVLNMAYSYDAKGNTTAITNNLYPTESKTFAYDELNRLTGINNTWASYSYDASGNRLSKRFGSNSAGYTYSSNRLISTTLGETFGYNNDGDMTSFNNYSLTYDNYHNLRSYSSSTTSLADYTYDGDGMRVSKTSNGKTIVYHYDQGGKVLSETDQNKNHLADYIYLHGKLVAKVAETVPTAPTNLDVWRAYRAQINLSWTDNSDNELEYIIERKTSSSGTYTVIATVAKNVATYSDMGLTPGVEYFYQVKATNQIGESAYSNAMSAIPTDNPVPSIAISPVVWNFGGAVVGGTPVLKTFAISNTGTDDLNIGALVITGTNAGSFTIPSSTDTCSNKKLVPHETHPTTCTFVVNFAPVTGGQNTGNITVSSNDSGSPQYISLQGMGQYTLTVQKNGTWIGTVTSQPSGINCGATCVSNFNGGTNITLTATPDADASFNGWSGSVCSGNTNPCIFTLNSHATVTATFNILPPIANFSASPTTASNVPFVPITFTDLSLHRPASWLWNFGDGTTSTEKNPVHTYRSVGSYAVTLTVTNATASDTKTIANYIIIQPCPDMPVRIKRNGVVSGSYTSLQAAYNVAQNQDVIEALAINFIENVNVNRPIIISMQGGFACGYAQQIGNSTIQGQVTTSDGSITMGNFELVANTPDNIYDIIVTAGSGGSISPSGVITISQGKNLAFTITPDTGKYIQDVLLDNVTVGSAATYTISNVTANHTIEARFSSTVPAVPTADFTGTPTTGTAPLSVTFTDLSTQSPSIWLWNFGDGTPNSTEKNPTHDYSAVGSYTVTLTATNGIGPGTVTKTNYIVVQPSATQNVRIAGPMPVYYSSIQAAYDVALDGGVIQVRDINLIQNLNANRNITISLEGGYNPDFSSGTGVTPLQGSITVNAGTATIKNFNLLQ
ncbi:MAG: PKD domain-containing protein [Nitrospirota bacterium]